MEHTLNINDRVLVNKLVYDFRDPHRGEIVVFEAPDEWRSVPNEEDFIKRVIGVGGDHVVCCDAAGPDHRQRQGRSTSRTSTSDGAGVADVAEPRLVRRRRAGRAGCG